MTHYFLHLVFSCQIFSIGRSGGGLHAHGAVQSASTAQPAQPLIRPRGKRPRPGSQGSTTERDGER